MTDRQGGGCHVAVDFQRVATSARGKFVGFAVQLTGSRRFAAELRQALDRLAKAPIEPPADPPSAG